VSVTGLRGELPALFIIWTGAVALVAALIAWPLTAVLQTGSLLATLGLSVVAGALVHGLWRSRPPWQAVERDGGTLRDHWESLGELEWSAWRGLGVALAVAAIATAVVLLAWPGLLGGSARWGLALAMVVLAPALHAWLRRVAPADEL